MSGNLVPIVLFVTMGSVAIFTPIARAFARRMDRASERSIPEDVQARLERMEQSIDTIAEQIERVAEGQRFTTKLLAERGPQRTPELRGE
ncbi:MAG: hypothetical protein ABI852_07715 [Gemmatimonadaceae bacterium]